jgi:hypothetical protein
MASVFSVEVYTKQEPNEADRKHLWLLSPSTAVIAACLMLVSRLDYSSNLKVNATIPLKPRFTIPEYMDLYRRIYNSREQFGVTGHIKFNCL